jgi:hypothetical protein
MAALTAAGSSMVHKWAASGMTFRIAPGMRSAIRLPLFTGIQILHLIAIFRYFTLPVAAVVKADTTIAVLKCLHPGIKMGMISQIAVGENDGLRAASHFLIVHLDSIGKNFRHCLTLLLSLLRIR